MIPVWLPWAVVAVFAAAALTGRESPFRLWAPATVTLLIAVWLTANHLVVTEGELFDAGQDAAAQLDGTVGVVTQDRIGIEVADRLGRDVRVESVSAPSSTDEPTERYQITPGDSDSDIDPDGPTVCLTVVDYEITNSPLTRAAVTADAGRCKKD